MKMQQVFFLIQNIDCGYSLESPRRVGSNVYPHSYVLSKNIENIKKNSTEYFQFLQLRKMCILYGRVFVMVPCTYF